MIILRTKPWNKSTYISCDVPIYGVEAWHRWEKSDTNFKRKLFSQKLLSHKQLPIFHSTKLSLSVEIKIIMEWRKCYLDVILVPLGFLTSIGYHFWLWHKVRTHPHTTIIGINASGRRNWVNTMIKVLIFFLFIFLFIYLSFSILYIILFTITCHHLQLILLHTANGS